MTQKLITEVTYTSDGNNLKYAIPFEYLARSHVHLYLNGTETTNFVWIDTYRIELTTAPATGTAVTIKRITPYDDTYITWQDGSIILADDLNAANMQNLFITQENLYRIGQMENKIQNTLDTALQTEEALKQYSKGSAVPFGRFYVGADGCLKLAIYGDYTPDNIFINEDGDLILRTQDPT